MVAIPIMASFRFITAIIFYKEYETRLSRILYKEYETQLSTEMFFAPGLLNPDACF